ncbi:MULTISPECIES: acyl-homoserine-lactone synthase [Roseobacter]|uniref:Acyl-homoserine-lactone synthase n=1 Tax=Roseobacter litoralis (strain ATCC 49566 / DSM 6996 / JCM 21268 / NBRC 15278 / OCh 149) TaxID=391595 RepID=F7ZIW4_ROSLO|nr:MULTISPECIES: acyl-homoserine-lactone synthase [Roseobacter]AEI95024.1 putative acyl-homoserine-lactone synthase [Roseobacter litoralis Och 149]GIT86796.1 acyl-homoserine-lactone synthase [Roseobacter sp. OBYS 0001]
MIRYLYADQLDQHPTLRDSMFRDRADQFKTRLGWDVDIDEDGFERDQYDALNPLYVIWENADGSHGGSMRFLPTTGRTMINEHFTDILGGGTITSPLIWECTRFCLSRGAQSKVAAALMLAGGEIMQNFDVAHFAGVFDARMVRIYRLIGSSPEVLGSTGNGRDKISVGLWEFTPDAQAKVAAKAGLSLELSRLWFNRAFGTTSEQPLAQAG